MTLFRLRYEDGGEVVCSSAEGALAILRRGGARLVEVDGGAQARLLRAAAEDEERWLTAALGDGGRLTGREREALRAAAAGLVSGQLTLVLPAADLAPVPAPVPAREIEAPPEGVEYITDEELDAIFGPRREGEEEP